MTWVQSQLDDESIFPSKIGVPFPKTFPSVVKNIFKRLFRVYAHIYHSHFRMFFSLFVCIVFQNVLAYFDRIFIMEISKNRLAGRRSPLEHLLQALHLLRARVSAD
jgi:hypothetical protein